MVENSLATVEADKPCADATSQFIGLIFTGGIGDVLLSLSALPWLSMAHPGRTFQAAYCHPEPQSPIANEVKNLLSAQPAIIKSRCTENIEAAIHSWRNCCKRTYNLSPCYFFTLFFRHAFPNLSLTLPPDCCEVVKALTRKIGKDFIIAHPFSGHPEYNWSVASWERLMELDYGSLPWVLLGGPNEPLLRGNATDLRGKLSLCQTLAVAQASSGAVVARSFVGIATTTLGIPTVTLTSAVKLHEMTHYYPQIEPSKRKTFSFVPLASNPLNVLQTLANLDAKGGGQKGIEA